MNSKGVTKLCITCFNCNEEKTQIHCDMGYFDETHKSKGKLYTPLDFDCIDYEG